MKSKHLLVLIALCALASASVGICINTAGLFYKPIAADLGVSVGSVSLTTTILTVASSFTALLVPKLLSEKTLRWIILTAGILLVSGTFLMSVSSVTALLYIASVLRGLGSGLASFVLITGIVNNWYYKSHGLITSIVLSFSGIPGVIFSPVITYLIQTFGWRFAMTAVTAATAVLFLPALLFGITIRPQTQSLTPYGYEEFLAEKEKGNIRVLDAGEQDFSFKTTEFALAVVFIAAVCIAASLPNYLPSFAESVDLAAISGVILSMTLAGNILSKIVFGVIADKVNAKTAIILFAIISLTSIVVLLTMNRFAAVILAAALTYNFTAANSSVGISILTSDLFGERNYTTVYPVLSFIGSYAMAFSNALIGLLYDKTGSFSVIFWIMIIVQGTVASAAFMGYRMRRIHTQQS
ncbi:MAG: MFS transporter [Solobacterium sp.]|nr:MFS transporter [Solobacterium sp.]